MPGDNCSVVGCGTCRRTKGIGIWKLPAARNDEYKTWREDWLNELTKYRVVDKDFKKKIDNDKVFTCERHFDQKDIEIFESTKMTKKRPKFGALPSLNMPQKSQQSKKVKSQQSKLPPRPSRSVQLVDKMESDWIEYKCKSGKIMLIYNKVTGVHKWLPGFNNGTSEDSIMYGQVEYKESHSIGTQTEDYGCNNGCTSMYIDQHHVSNISEILPQPQPGVSVDGEHDLDNEHGPENTLEDEDDYGCNNGCTSMYINTDPQHISNISETLPQPQPGVSVDAGEHDLDDEHDPENTLEEEEQNQDMDEIYSIPSMLEKHEFYPGYKNLVKTKINAKDNSTGDGKDKNMPSLKCSYCTKQFKYKCRLTIHLRTHTGQKPFDCSYCEKKFLETSVLKRHLKVHTRDKPFECSCCEKKRALVLKRHIITHTGEKTFECSYCEKKFAYQGDFKQHLRIPGIHTGDKPFACSYCGKKFRRNDHLNIHLRMHTGEKHFECSYCKKKLSVKSDLNRHLRKHLGACGEKPIECSL